ncbi:MAG: FtsX-like permease family protein [Acidobacteria bacterium]|nr:FtsX-like permease family protein [Acidobacteriota bacterium]
MTRPQAVVVGIVADERHNGVTAAVKEKFYVPHSQWHVVTGGNLVRNAFVVLRTAGDPLALAGPVREAVHRVDARLPIAGVRPMTDVVATALATPRLSSVLLGAFAVIALALAVVGLYGVLSYVVARRTHEIGIRMAIGASRRDVVTMILRHGLGLALAGTIGGLVAAVALARVLRGLLYEVAPVDPLTFALVTATMLVVAALASLVPAARALRVSAVAALRTD